MAKLTREEHAAMKNAEKAHTVVPNMYYKDSAPQLISLIGPAGSGKSYLLNSLILHFTKRTVKTNGLVTITIDSKRISFLESSNDILGVIDVLKVSDIILLTVNKAVGLERETLEAFAMVHSHGAVKVIVILTDGGNKAKSDKLKQNKEKILKILKREHFNIAATLDLEDDGIQKVARSIELLKTRPIVWKSTHPHIVADNVVDDYLYGYIRGGPIAAEAAVHIPGHGDNRIAELEVLEDPCLQRSKKAGFYAPMIEEPKEVESSEAVELEMKEETVRLFSNNRTREMNQPESESATEEVEDETEHEVSSGTLEDAVNSAEEEEEVKERFQRAAATEDDFIAKFKEKEVKKEDKNLLQKQRENEEKRIKETEMVTRAILPGTYCKIRLKTPLNLTNFTFLILGTYLPTEGTDTMLGGKVTKNKWQKKDLKSNSPYFISMGWHRFQTIPIFTAEGTYKKYLRNTCVSRSESIVFYGPSVPIGTGFFIFNTDNPYRILGTGNITDPNGNTTIKKKLKLVGYPERIMGKNAIVQSMFTSDKEVDRFSHAKLKCASGLRGVVKTPVGTAGHFRATFEAPILSSEIVFLRCFVPVLPKRFLVQMREGAVYVKYVWELKAELGVAESESSVEESELEEIGDQTAEIKREIKRLETQLPFDKRRIREVKEKLVLPIPPGKRRELDLRTELDRERVRRDREEEETEEMKRRKKREEMEIREAEKRERRRALAVKSKRMKERRRR